MPSKRKRVQVLLSAEAAAAVEELTKRLSKSASATCSTLIEVALARKEIKTELKSAGGFDPKTTAQKLEELISTAEKQSEALKALLADLPTTTDR